jgi:hypothetical protein
MHGMSEVPRREFLKAASAAGVVAAVVGGRESSAGAAADVRISSRSYTPREYPIRAQRHSKVRITDRFWQPKLTTNATVTIPIEARKLQETERGLSGNVLEAAILSLETRPDPTLQAQVDASIERMKSAPERGNAGFEVAAAWFAATGKRDLLERATRIAAGLYDEFATTNPPWFLPSRDELALLYRNLGAAGLGGLRDGGSRDNVSYWASTQLTADMAAHIDFADAGRQHFDDKDFPRRVRAIRSF